jgi:hypothetical protein
MGGFRHRCRGSAGATPAAGEEQAEEEERAQEQAACGNVWWFGRKRMHEPVAL